MTQKAQALVLAEPDASLRAALEAACQDAGYELVVEPSAEVATSKLSAKRFDALVLDMTTPGAALVCMKARGKLVRVRIPVIALVEEEDEVAFARAYRAGADEVLLAGRPAALTTRLRSLPKSGIPQPSASRGDAVVADADRARAEVLERVLRDAGFRVELAVDGFAARLQVGRPTLKVAVLDASLDDAAALISQARTRGARCAWIVRGRPDGIEELRTQLAKLDRVAVVNAYGPPDDVLFEANRLLEPRQSDGRADQRQLYGTIVNLRWEGRGDAEIGYAYNVSSVGLYVRTLAAPSASTVELELLPPGMDKKVRLLAEVIWRREFGTTRREPVPAGFGLKLTGGDLETWTKACPRALSLPPRSILPVPEDAKTQPPPPSALSTVRPDAPLDVVLTEASEKVAPGPKRSSYADKLRLPERLRSPVASSFTEATKRKEPSPSPPRVTEKEPVSPPKAFTGREPQSSVEEMLLSVLSGSSPGEDALGAAPLSIDGDEVVALEKPGHAAAAPSEEPPAPSVEPPAPSVEPPAPSVEPPAPSVIPRPARALKSSPTAAPPVRGNVDAPPPSGDAPVIEVHGGPSVAPPKVEPRTGDSEAPTIEVHARMSAAPAPAATPSEPPEAIEPEIIEPPAVKPLPVSPAPAATPSEPPEPIEPEIIEPPAVKRPPAPPAPAISREEPDAVRPKPSDPLAATVPAGLSPFHTGALPDPRLGRAPMSEAPQTTPSQVPPSASNIEPDGEIEIPKNRSSGMLWLSLFAIGAGVAAFFAVPLIRDLLAPPSTAAKTEVAPVSTPAAMTAPVATTAPAAAATSTDETVASAPAEEAAPPSALPNARPAASPTAPEPPLVPAAASAAAPIPSPQPGGGEEPDQAALSSLEKGTGFLYVASSIQTNVYLYGVLAGVTNQRLVSKCGPRFIRLGTAPGTWQSDGVVSVVKCGGFTRVQIAP